MRKLEKSSQELKNENVLGAGGWMRVGGNHLADRVPNHQFLWSARSHHYDCQLPATASFATTAVWKCPKTG